MDCIVLSISSAIGQLFIFYTIANFGPVVFTIIMTMRQVCTYSGCVRLRTKNYLKSFITFQAIAILLSCLVYNHHISGVGIFGILIVFLALLLRVYCAQRLKMLRRKVEINKSSKNPDKNREISA